ncbi:MAG TPA: hypothetical protein QGH10_24360, partial [Armatimonadota bacterium]|nr:hypothetical protein [Armatimonadota bacterium]
MCISQLVCVTSATVLLLAPVAVRAGDVLLQGDDPLAVASVDPIRPSIAAEDAATGGLDAGLPGDTSYYRLSVEPVGKRFYQTPDALMIYIDTTDVQGDLHIELGIYRSRYGSRNGEVCWDGTKILDVDAYGGEDLRVETLTHT